VRESESLRAFRTFFSTYSTVQAFKPGDVVVDNVPVWHGQVGTTALTVAEPLGAYVSQAQRGELKASVRYNQPLVAPAEADKPVGEVTLTLPDGTTATTALVPLRPLPAGGFISRFVQSAAAAVGL
jgi:serine-type D-Ala-D-Ala carboxypeptidase (penicillin-binding protein 5/6)